MGWALANGTLIEFFAILFGWSAFTQKKVILNLENLF